MSNKSVIATMECTPMDGSQNVVTDDDNSSDGWGFFEDEYEASSKNKTTNYEIRDAWFKLSMSLAKSPSINSFTRGLRKLNSKYTSDVDAILNVWINPNPELSIKAFVVEEDIKLSTIEHMNMSCCVSGFRIVQLKSGEIVAQYHCVFCYGSRTYSAWKFPSEFKELSSILTYMNSIDETMFADTLRIWKLIETYEKWYVCMRAPYLIEKSIALGSFIQSLFTESPTPGLMICFIQNENFSID